MSPTALTLDTTRRDGQLVLIASGEIDLSNIDTFAQVLATAITADDNGAGKLTVDLSAVEYLDSAGINALMAHAEHIRLVAHPILIPVLTVSGLTELVTVESAARRADTKAR